MQKTKGNFHNKLITNVKKSKKILAILRRIYDYTTIKISSPIICIICTAL